MYRVESGVGVKERRREKEKRRKRQEERQVNKAREGRKKPDVMDGWKETKGSGSDRPFFFFFPLL